MSSVNKCTHICTDCNKNYSSRQSLWNHIYKYHKLTSAKNPPSSTDLPPESAKIHQKYF